ncbi:MAG: RsmB/NOP family class I SAM-dependent RNA methyltransferase [Lachnospiraceae bacterium]|nr:RsmB/NOP family class I SAM-dependent RNA methyltransferase [Lachnospiraceae bacterium]
MERSLKERLPEAFIEEIRTQLSEKETEAFLSTYDGESLHGLRFHAQKTEEGERKRVLEELGVTNAEAVSWAENAYYYPSDRSPGKHVYHEAGLYYIQEPSAMRTVALLAPKPGERVLDLCAAPGGKSTQILSCIGKEGLLVSNEIVGSRARILAGNLERLGAANAVVTNCAPAELSARFPSFFTSVVVDAPCSGEGMFRKNPDAIDEWSPENVGMCAARQREILTEAAKTVMPGGRLVYSTCTFAEKEDEAQVKMFLEEHPEFELLASEKLWPHKEKGEGHFVALFLKRGTLNLEEFTALAEHAGVLAENHALSKKPGHKSGKRSNDKGLSNIDECVRSFFSRELAIKYEELSYLRELVLFGDEVYLVPSVMKKYLSGLKVERAGLWLGTMKKNRFEPGHALAMALRKEDALRVLNLSVSEDAQLIKAYLRGESLPIYRRNSEGENSLLLITKKEEDPMEGWTLVCVENHPLGWAKTVQNQAKNHYPKGLRKEITV